MSLLLALISGGGGISGSLAATESGSDTFAATGSVLVSGTLAATESGSDTFAATGGVLVSGSLAATESGPDTFAAAGTVSNPAITGTLAATESGSDTFAATGSVIVSGTLAATESGPDVFAASGIVLQIYGTLAASESGSDTFAAAGTVTGDAVPQGGGMGGWGRERAVLEWSIRERMAQQTLQKSTSKPARRIAKAMEDYTSERIAFETLRSRTLALARQLERQQGLAADLRQAARDVAQFIQDEQDALDMILLADAMDAEMVGALILH